ncbi:hypothetical protein B0H14DRAFT_2569525 [Mycena olivaceomarginata]|nr:hypothetical protein B0H14DRAFT_2569525 [Mycena olivaceomarginata]
MVACTSAAGDLLFHSLTTLSVRDWPIPGLAVVDLVLIVIEASGIITGFVFMNFLFWQGKDGFPSLLTFAWIPLVLSLTFSIIFRSTTIMLSNGSFFRQRPTNPPYTSTTILLNRSLARPLVRGESVVIITARALILSCVAVGLPTFGIYAMIISPIQASVYTRTVATFAAGDLGSPAGNVIFGLGYANWDPAQDYPYKAFSVNYVGFPKPDPRFNCSVTQAVSNSDRFQSIIQCPWWAWVSVGSVSISLDIPPGYVVTVTPLQEMPAMVLPNQIESDSKSVRLHVPINPIPMISGSSLFGSLTWTRRETLSDLTLGVAIASKPVFTAEITGLQTYPSSNSTASPNSATLVLYQPYSYATKLLRDSSDVSPLSGLATFGGFWTFVDGAFALFFGANVLYFGRVN